MMIFPERIKDGITSIEYPWPYFRDDALGPRKTKTKSKKLTWRFNQEQFNMWQRGDLTDTQAIKLSWCWKNSQSNTNHTYRDGLLKGKRRMDVWFLLSIADDHCPCCNREMDYGKLFNRKIDSIEPSLDRIVSQHPSGVKVAYSNGGVWIICNTCNKLKEDVTSPYSLINRGKFDAQVGVRLKEEHEKRGIIYPEHYVKHDGKKMETLWHMPKRHNHETREKIYKALENGIIEIPTVEKVDNFYNFIFN